MDPLSLGGARFTSHLICVYIILLSNDVARRKFNFFLGPSLNKSVDLHSTISDKGMHKIDSGMPKNKLNSTQTSSDFSQRILDYSKI